VKKEEGESKSSTPLLWPPRAFLEGRFSLSIIRAENHVNCGRHMAMAIIGIRINCGFYNLSAADLKY
jgi:hypothetical protein